MISAYIYFGTVLAAAPLLSAFWTLFLYLTYESRNDANLSFTRSGATKKKAVWQLFSEEVVHILIHDIHTLSESTIALTD